jgi:hypothetical protein
MSQTPEASTQPNIQPPIYFAGGLGYGEARNSLVLEYIQTLGHETIPALPDQEALDCRFTVTVNGLNRVISRERAMLVASRGSAESISANYQQTRANELITMLEQQGHSGIRAIFQSADALNGLEVMRRRPGLIDHAVFAYPAGVYTQPWFWKAEIGLLRTGWERWRLPAPPAAENFEKHGPKIKRARIAGNLTVAASVALSHQSSPLSEIRSREDAPGISWVFGLRDHMIVAERAIESLESPTDVDYILVTDKPHGVNEVDEWLKLFPLMAEAKAAHDAGQPTTEPLTSRMVFFGDIPQQKRDELLALAARIDAKANN